LPTLNTSKPLKQASQLSRLTSQHPLHQGNIQTKQKHKETLTTTECDLAHLQRSKAPTPHDPLHKLKAIKSLGTSLAWWAHNLLETIGLEIRLHKQVTHTQRHMNNAWSEMVSSTPCLALYSSRSPRLLQTIWDNSAPTTDQPCRLITTLLLLVLHVYDYEQPNAPFPTIWEFLRCLDLVRIWLEWFECGGVDLRGLEVFRPSKDLTWVVWVWRSWFEWFGGVYTSKRSDWRGLSEGSWFDRFGCVYSLKGSDLSGLNVERLILEVWRCLYFQKIRLERFGRV